MTAAPAPQGAGGGTTQAVTSAPGTAPAPRPPADFWQQLMGFAPIIVIVVVFYFLVLRRGGKEREQEKIRKQQIEAMKKGDEVLLISGKFGKVVDVKEDRVVVKVDEANNVKETYLKSAIQKVIADEPEGK